MVWTLKTTWSTVCSSAPHSQAAEEAIPYLYKHEWKRPIVVRRRLSWTQALLRRIASVGWVSVLVMKIRSLVGLSAHSMFYWWSTQCAARMLLLSEELMGCCVAGTNGCLDLRCRGFALNRQVSIEWSKCPGSTARCAKDSVAPMRQSSAGWMPARIGRLSAGVGCRHPVIICKVSLMAESIWQVWALWHQTRVQYSAGECTRDTVSVRRVIAPATQLDPASHFRNTACLCQLLAKWPKVLAIIEQPVQCSSGIWAQSRGAGSRYWSWLSAHISLIVKVEGCWQQNQFVDDIPLHAPS